MTTHPCVVIQFGEYAKGNIIASVLYSFRSFVISKSQCSPEHPSAHPSSTYQRFGCWCSWSFIVPCMHALCEWRDAQASISTSPFLFWARRLGTCCGRAYGRIFDRLLTRRSGDRAYIYHDIKLRLLLFGIQAQYTYVHCGRRSCFRTWAVVSRNLKGFP